MSLLPFEFETSGDHAAWCRSRDIVDADMLSKARAIFKAETGKACPNSAMQRVLRMAVLRALTAEVDGAEAPRFFLSGPDGEFWTNDREFAERLLREASHDREEWTITDLQSPAGEQR